MTNHTYTALVIPAEGDLYEITLTNAGGDLDTLQAAVGGLIEALPLPEFVDRTGRSTAYVNGEGKFDPDCKPNMRATDFMVPGIGIHFDDYIAGSFVLAGFNPNTGDHADLPKTVTDRARLIEREAA